jgi:galactose mutarotase-like enzyme
MLCSSLVHGDDELLHLRAGIAAYAERGKTCGIPFLHPWANRLSGDRYEAGGEVVVLTDGAHPPGRDANGLPNHGLLGGRTAWETIEEVAGNLSAALTARFRFDAPELLANFPFPHHVTMRVTLTDDDLTIATSIDATSARAVPVSFGYHPYFRLPGIPREQWKVEIPVREHLVVDARQIPTGVTEPALIPPGPIGDRTYDDGFTGIVAPRVFALEGAGRRIEVELGDNYPYVQMYAPAGAEFVCIEPMTAAADALVRGESAGLRFAEPGKRFDASFRVRVGG